jgi:predicted aldo/keto reductase-like oxidoreductase
MMFKRPEDIMSISRRRFLGTAALTGVAANIALGAEVDKKTGMPTRILGKTGARVSILAFGCGSRFLMYKNDDEAVAALNHALDLGITYVDTAYGYGNGKSEERVGKVMATRRKGLFLATKINARKYDDAMRILEGSIKRLQTDHVDLIHVHSLTTADDLAEVEAPDGVLKALHKLRDEKVTRFIGVTSHTDPTVLKAALEHNDFDCTQMALNAARAGMTNGRGGMVINEAMHDSFEHIALPVANAKNMGIIAMKVFAQEGLSGKAPIEKLIGYSLSLPVTAAVVGMPKPEYIDQNIQIAKGFKPLGRQEMMDLSGRLALEHKASLDQFFCNHVDA